MEITYKTRILPYCSKFGPCFLNIDNPCKKYFTMKDYQQIMEYFFPETLKHELVAPTNEANICLTSINLENNSLLRDNECNIMISIENITNPNFSSFYSHYKNYGEYRDEKIKIYIYSHISKLVKNEKYLAIPAVYCRINYFRQKYDFFKNHVALNCTFQNKKFCLAINRSGINSNIAKIKKKMSQIGEVHDMSMFAGGIVNKTCYNSIELLQLFNRYKFIICFENSYADGYITEKIFNCFFAKTIPVYSGSPIISRFFDNNSFINLTENNHQENLSLIQKISCNEDLYNTYINHNKINQSYDDENYKEEFMKYLKSTR